MKHLLKNDDEKIYSLYKKLQEDGWADPYGIFAELLEIKAENLIYWLYRQPEGKFYETFRINKRGGGKRIIHAPKDQIKMLQQRMNYVFQLVIKIKPVAHAFTKEKSIITNASCHIGQKNILNFDLKDFFPSIHYGRVYGLFKSKPFSFTDKVAAALAKLCTYKGMLPQGAPTSPIISNLICRRLDQQLLKLANKYGCTYTRYADDITISTHQKKFPQDLAIRDAAGFVELGEGITQIVNTNDFQINPKKTRLLSSKDRQIVTGLVVNQKLNVSRKYISKVRAMLHALEIYGPDAAAQHFFTKYYLKHRASDKEECSFEAVLHGKLVFLKQVRESNGSIDPLTRTLYNKFLTLTGHGSELLPLTMEEASKRQLYQELCQIKAIQDQRTRGYKFQDFLPKLFDFYGLCPTGPFNGTAEEIDGAFEYKGNTYLVEAKYRKVKTGLPDLTSFQAKARRRSAATRGLFISFNGFTPKAVKRFQSEQQGNMVILMDGTDIEYILQNSISLPMAFRLKLKHLQQQGNLGNSLSELETLYPEILQNI